MDEEIKKAPRETTIFYSDDEIVISADAYNWILAYGGSNAYYGDLKGLFLEILQLKLKNESKKYFSNLQYILDDHARVIQEILDKAVNFTPDRIIKEEINEEEDEEMEGDEEDE